MSAALPVWNGSDGATELGGHVKSDRRLGRPPVRDGSAFPECALRISLQRLRRRPLEKGANSSMKDPHLSPQVMLSVCYQWTKSPPGQRQLLAPH